MITKLAILVFAFILIPILNAHAEDSTNVHPGFYEISQYAIGTVGIQIIFVESDGSVDSDKYNWTESEMKQTEKGIKKGLDFWSEKYPFEYGKLEFVFKDSVIGTTGIESSTRTADGWFHFDDYRDVVVDTLTDVGCGNMHDTRAMQYPSLPSSLKNSGNEFKILVLSCANDVRNDLDTDWATIIFVPYTSYQVDGLAFGFMDGAFMQDRYMVTVNGGGLIPAHEWAHMVGATDMIECDLFGPDDDACGERSGYLHMEETDTVPMTNCILGSTGNNPGLPNVCISDGTKNQMGWVDENDNNIPDLVENAVTVNLSEKQKKDGPSIIIEGTVHLEPVKCKAVKIPRDVITNSKDWSCKDTTINKIIQVTSIPTTEIKPTDGKFDSGFEEFTITLNTAELNNNEIEIKVKDEITGRIHSSTFVLDVEVSETTETAIPDWIKNTAGWWAEDQIDDGSFVSGIQWLISNGIISIPPTEQGAGSDDAIPSWIKNNAGWWADGQIDDNSFVSGLQWLISNGIMILTQETAEPKPEVKSAFTISSADGYEKYFSKQVNVFGVTILASNNTPDSKVLHVANVFAQYLDNDADGTPDNSKVIYSLKKNKAHFLMCETEDEVECTNWSDDGKWLDDMLIDTGSCSQSQYADETGINNEKFGAFDASLEEVLHLISNCGYGGAYPDVFRSNSVSLIGQYMDNARGGHFEKIPNSYPADAWYSYDDNSCIYNCMITEYFYWAMTSILGAQEDRFDEIGHEWKLNTKEKVMETDPDIYNLLTDPQYKLPTILPDGNYQG